MGTIKSITTESAPQLGEVDVVPMKGIDALLHRVLTDETFLFDRSVPFLDKHHAFKRWLHAWQRYNLPMLRSMEFSASKYASDVTLVIYSFGGFDIHEFPILHTWRLLGKMPVSIVTDEPSASVVDFQKKCPDFVSVKMTDGLVRGDTNSMSTDCMTNLYKYFDTPYCLIIQDDGFPIQDNFDQFLGKWDCIGAPSVRDSFRQHIADLLLKDCLNGGFSLRSRRYCQAVARNWQTWGRRYSKLRGFGPEEDFLYSCVMRLNPWMRIRYRLPGAKTARRFAFFDLLGGFDARGLKEVPFGLHGQSTIWQFRKTMRDLGYDLDAPFMGSY